jgi:glycosyltransferase involved in cell wall biosynthesis
MSDLAVSIIIPTLNEQQYIPHVLKPLKKYDVIVVDGGSRDRTTDIAKRFGTRVILAKGTNIAEARNIGAKLAYGDIQIQLDADTFLTEEMVKEVEKIFESDKNVVGGTFRLYPYDGSWYHALFLTLCAVVIRSLSFLPISSRPRVAGSVIFMRKEAYDRVGGYWNIPVAEDQRMASRLSKIGKFVLINKVAYTSARRWIKWGFFKATAIMLINSWMAVMLDKTWSKKW